MGGNIDELEAFISKFFRRRYLEEKVQSELDLQKQLEMHKMERKRFVI